MVSKWDLNVLTLSAVTITLSGRLFQSEMIRSDKKTPHLSLTWQSFWIAKSIFPRALICSQGWCEAGLISIIDSADVLESICHVTTSAPMFKTGELQNGESVYLQIKVKQSYDYSFSSQLWASFHHRWHWTYCDFRKLIFAAHIPLFCFPFCCIVKCLCVPHYLSVILISALMECNKKCFYKKRYWPALPFPCPLTFDILYLLKT